MTKKLFKIPQNLIDLLEEEDYSIYDDDSGYVEISKYSTAGQDWSTDIALGEDINEFADNIYSAYESYDPEYEVSLWIGDDGHGKNGAPYHIKDIVEDMEECEGFIRRLYIIVREYADNNVEE
jgi:hypothetical protein